MKTLALLFTIVAAGYSDIFADALEQQATKESISLHREQLSLREAATLGIIVNRIVTEDGITEIHVDVPHLVVGMKLFDIGFLPQPGCPVKKDMHYRDDYDNVNMVSKIKYRATVIKGCDALNGFVVFYGQQPYFESYRIWYEPNEG